ncbi:MAG TPA: hypothetical protein PLG15_03685 [Candidatus Gastranaerophilaceae bacterium]|nr:hypothetical protein [Candidatus Gastranaerophilaceae bacterium]HPT41466.1 hypothetical protein [Candidatus Gastranaerophilaceae bacterium]
MKRAVILLVFYLFGTNSGFCDVTYFPPLQPLGTNANNAFALRNYNQVNNADYQKITQIENSLYGKNFAYQDILIRLSRIEKNIFNRTYPNLSLSQRVDNIVANYNQTTQYPNISKNTLSKMEMKIFGQNYNGDSPEVRIERLEQQLLGAVQSGDITTRYTTLKTLAGNYNSNQYSQNYYSNPIVGTQGGWKGVLGSLGGMLLGGNGMMTGFTPPIDQYYGYSNPSYLNYSSLGNPGYGYYNGYRTNHGYYDRFNNYGSQTGVTILD